jgi:hypothetical protein
MHAGVELGRVCGVALLTVGLSACTGWPSEAIERVDVYDLTQGVSRADVETPSADYVDVRTMSIAGEQRRALFMHPTSSVEFPPVRPGAGSVLTFDLGIAETVWEERGDGVTFEVWLRLEGGATVKVFSRYLDPKARPEDRGWFSERVPLGAFEGQPIRVRLATTPGPRQDAAFDWAAWGRPRLVLGAVPD